MMTGATIPRVRSGSDSLNDVRTAIPDACYQRSAARASWALLRASVLYLAPVAGLVLTNRWWAPLILWPLAGLGVAGLFVLGHDASHGAMVESRRVNRTIARVCMVPSAHVEAAWDLGHNRIHHGYTTRQGFDFVWHPVTVDEYRAMSRLARLRHRFEWSMFGSGAYFLRVVWWDKMWRFSAPGKRHGEIVRDKIVLGAVIALAIGGTSTFGALAGGWMAAVWMPIKLFVVPFLLFTQIIGWTVYVHHISPEIRWWSRREWTQFTGQMESTTIVRVPSAVNYLWFYNIFVHVPHHVDTRLPFHQLPSAAAAIADAYPHTVRTSRLSPSEYVRTTGVCKLYDFDAGRWLAYPATRQHSGSLR